MNMKPNVEFFKHFSLERKERKQAVVVVFPSDKHMDNFIHRFQGVLMFTLHYTKLKEDTGPMKRFATYGTITLVPKYVPHTYTHTA